MKAEEKVKELTDAIIRLEDTLSIHRTALETIKTVCIDLSGRVKQLEIHNQIQGYINGE